MHLVEAAFGRSSEKASPFWGAGLCPWVFWQLTEWLSLSIPRFGSDRYRPQHLCDLRLACCPQGNLEVGVERDAFCG